MRVKFLIAAVAIVFLQLSCYAQETKYTDLHNYISAHCKPSDGVIAQCGWQLAMVKVSTNKVGHVINYNFLNQASDSLKLAFKPLLRYKFPAKLNMKSRTFVFAQTYYNLTGKCSRNDLPDVQNVFEITYQCFIKQLKLDPRTVFDDMIFTSMSNDEAIIDKHPLPRSIP